jgi:methionine-rich copper-binding protein CopC
MMVSNLRLKNELGSLLGVHTTKELNAEISEKTVPLSLYAKAGNYTLTFNQVSSFSSEFVFYLENTLKNTIQLIEEGKEFPIYIAEGEEENMSNAYQLRITRGSITESPISEGLRVYPNPSNGKNITVVVGDETNKGNIEISDSMGKIVWSSSMTAIGNSLQINMPDDISSGLYTISWKTLNKTRSTRIAIQ